MPKTPKMTVSIRIEPDLLKDLDELVEKEGTTRSELIERMIAFGVRGENRFIKSMEHPIGGKFWKLMMSEEVVGFLDLISGGKVDPDRAQAALRVVQAAEDARGNKQIRDEAGDVSVGERNLNPAIE